MQRKSRIDFARERAREIFHRMGIDPSAARASLSDGIPDFKEMFDLKSPLNDAQKKIADLQASPSGALVIVEAPTGSGKTEMALERYLILFSSGDVDGMYFALPTRTAATQIFKRVTKCIERVFPAPDTRPPVTLAVPGYLAFDETKGVRLSKFEVLWDDDVAARARYRGWASEQSKRYLAGSIVIGTIDQVLLSRLATKHSHMRATALLRHLLVIDEVHASDVYMTRLTKEVLDWQLKAGGHALLMSATLGGAVRHYYLQQGKKAPPPPPLECEGEPFPLITYKSPGEPSVKKLAPALERTIEVTVDIRNLMLEPERVASLSFDAASEGAHVLTIRNTVAECLKTQSSLERIAGPGREHLFRCQGVAAPHHSRFARQDRVLLDEAVEDFFGKKRPQAGVALAATQTIQQSLDLDADLLITDLCPMDVLLQRIGRLFRHLREVSERPAGFRRPRVIVLVPKERDLGGYLRKSGDAIGPCGIGTVYADLCALDATWRLLEGHDELRLPGQCRKLVEGALHPEVLNAIAEQFGEPWIRHRKQIDGIQFAQRRVAELNLADWKSPFGDPHALFPEAASNRKIAARLGDGDRWIHFPEPFKGPFGIEIQTLTLPAHQARGMLAEIQPTRIAPIEGGATFFLGDGQFIYDRLGMRPVRQREEDAEDVTP